MRWGTRGSGLYIDAFVNGLDDFPPADQKLRAELTARLREEGVGALAEELRSLDPESCEVIDLSNGQRVLRALEVCLMTGRKFSSFKTSPKRRHDFRIEKIGLMRPKEKLYSRIDARVLKMIDEGLVEEVRGLISLRDRPALQTVGYKEIFAWFDYLDGKVSTGLKPEHGKRLNVFPVERDIAFGKELQVDFVPDPHGVGERAVEVEDDRVDFPCANKHACSLFLLACPLIARCAICQSSCQISQIGERARIARAPPQHDASGMRLNAPLLER